MIINFCNCFIMINFLWNIIFIINTYFKYCVMINLSLLENCGNFFCIKEFFINYFDSNLLIKFFKKLLYK